MVPKLMFTKKANRKRKRREQKEEKRNGQKKTENGWKLLKSTMGLWICSEQQAGPRHGWASMPCG